MRVLASAAASARLSRDDWEIQQEGDGQLALVPLDETEPRFVDEFMQHLDNELARHNRQLVPEARLRLRVALHHGVAYAADNGFAGDAVITVSRLINSQVCRRALAESDSNLVLLLSEEMYKDVVVAEHTTRLAGEFQQVTIDEEKVFTEAWLWTPGTVRPDSLQQATANRRGTVTQARRDVNSTFNQQAQSIQNVYGGAHAETINFGTVQAAPPEGSS
ncbi:hypothetical protein [Catellatospora vulcania]|uniref:hypothetical protein n=1 Tax=Catellatospora vulcania TaxID=1460450 RepID=UPI0012D3CF65|nr:hypothetical protein [Catellatospora vulcania]